MSRNWLLSVLCIATALVFAQLSSAGNGLRVNESATRFLVQDQTLVELEIDNPSKQSLPTHVSLGLLPPKEVVCANAKRDNFGFKFRPRFALTAKTAASTLTTTTTRPPMLSLRQKRLK